MILAGDVGGTKVHLALFDFTDGNLKHARDKKFPAKEYAGLEEIVKEFVVAEKVTAACFGVPGPVREGRLRLTNLPWTLDSRELARESEDRLRVSYQRFAGERLRHCRADADQIYTLSEGDARQVGNRALISAGTGLGEAFLIWDGRRLRSLSLRGRALGFCAAQRGRDRLAALPAAEVQRAHQL